MCSTISIFWQQAAFIGYILINPYDIMVGYFFIAVSLLFYQIVLNFLILGIFYRLLLYDKTNISTIYNCVRYGLSRTVTKFG